MNLSLPVIPETIRVHIGAPDAPGENVTVSFPEYIKNVASGEIYPTWPQAALEANIYAQISYALNRVYTEYYPSRGYDFDITSVTQSDQSFSPGREVFENISQIVDGIFNNYVRRQGNVEPLFTQYCDGRFTACEGLSQWGSLDLANKGYSAAEILRYYYGDDIEIVSDAPVAGISSSVPYRLLRVGSIGNDVLAVENRLNRISVNYPSIMKIADPNGVFTTETEAAVREFQRIFDLDVDGIVGKATWYKIELVYNAVKRLNELDSEGLTVEDITKQYYDELVLGNNGPQVLAVQYLLKYVSVYYDTVPDLPLSGYYGPDTVEAVSAFQRTEGLEPTGVMDAVTYEKLYDAYTGLIASLPDSLFTDSARPYPGYPLSLGMQNQQVIYLQTYLNRVSDVFTSIPKMEVNGLFGTNTRDAVEEFQRLFSLPVNSIVGPVTWNKLAETYNEITGGTVVREGQYPGYVIGEDM
ncbi:MAG: peptidoglycan-binding protein [Clostridia bacterium]|nr:peptidoglycan-binding protein [Clostridia bacterium]